MSTITLTPPNVRLITFGIIGATPLIMHKWSEKAKKMMRLTAAERKKIMKVARDPEQEAADAMYTLPDGSPGFPVVALKAALIDAAHKDLGLERTLFRKAFFIHGAHGNLVPFDHSDPILREDFVRVGRGQSDFRYRPMFEEWRVTIQAEIDYDLLNEQDVVNLVNRAGFSIGLLEWRPSCDGEFGRFRLDTNVPVTMESIDHWGVAA